MYLSEVRFLSSWSPQGEDGTYNIVMALGYMARMVHRALERTIDTNWCLPWGAFEAGSRGDTPGMKKERGTVETWRRHPSPSLRVGKGERPVLVTR